MIKAHIYGQAAWHDDVYIVGEYKSLLAIYVAIQDALMYSPLKKHGRAELFASDGEGYTLHVMLLEDEATWNKLALPYYAEYAEDTRDGMILPQELP